MQNTKLLHDKGEDGKYTTTCENLGVMLQTFVESAERNCDRKKQGYRFDELTKMFSAYIFMLSGPLAYETLNANLPLSVPSVSTVSLFIRDNGTYFVEGFPYLKMQHDVLPKFHTIQLPIN